MRKATLLLLSSVLIATSALAGGGIFGHKAKSVNTNGVHSIGVHICGSLECPPVRILEGKCDGEHMEKRWGVCVCDKGYVSKGGKCEACPEGQYSDGIHGCQGCPEGRYMAHDGDTECSDCPDGSYCHNGKKYECPEYAVCSATEFDCNEGFTTTLTSCVCEGDKYIDGGICKECPVHTCPAGSCCVEGPADVCGHPTLIPGFKDNIGICRDCAYTDSVYSTVDECAKCDSVGTPRIFIEDSCYLKKSCEEGKFADWHDCIDCANGGYYYTNADECAKCDTTANPRIFTKNNYCWPTLDCPDGQFQGGNSCYDCSYTGGFYSSAEACSKCDTTANPRIFMGDGGCYLKKDCSAGQFRGWYGDCYDCSYTGGTPFTADECAKCDSYIPREMFTDGDGDSLCVLPCPDGQIHDDNGYCTDCSTEGGIYGITSDECAKCDAYTPREMLGRFCSLKKDCGVDEIRNLETGECEPCDYAEAYDGGYYTRSRTTPEECSKCEKKRVLINEDPDSIDWYYCTACPENEYVDRSGYCASCDEDYSREVSADSCALCGDKRRMVTNHWGDALCALSDCGDKRYLSTEDGQCHNCDGYRYETTEEECSKCGEYYLLDSYMMCTPCDYSGNFVASPKECSKCSTSSTPRKILEYDGKTYCSKANCPDGTYPTVRGCAACASSYHYDYEALYTDEESCNQCSGTNVPRWLAEDGVCYPCSWSSALKSTAEQCQNCGTKRVYDSKTGLCSLKGISCSLEDGAEKCPDGYFCNAAGNGTPNICEVVTPKTVIIDGITYYYNSMEDLLSWCRPDGAGDNCTWGYLSWFGAKDWCESLGKNLLTKAELWTIRTNFIGVLPDKTNIYWCSDGSVNISNGSTGSLYRTDGYANTGGVVCK